MLHSCRKILLCFCWIISCSSIEKDKDVSTKHNPVSEIFIAHAGGQIAGHTYTNSLEALDSSYTKGCRMFELDIVESSDSIFVAAHDWVSFKTIVGYGERDNSPLSKQEFLSQRIHGNYTPIDIATINAWFKNHKDAILVTDKINVPKRFVEHFLYKDRLIMELFSWEAVIEALEIDVKAMPSENLFFGTPNIEYILDSLNIKYIAVSRRLLQGNEALFLRLKSKGIKTYVFNLDEEKDERYVFENELYMITGMYADNLSLFQLELKR